MNRPVVPMNAQIQERTVDLVKDRNVTLQADLFSPIDAEPAPLIIAASGGGWRRGHRSQLGHWGRFFAANGIGFASIDYRRCTDGPCFPDNMLDVVACIKELQRGAEDYGFAADRFALLGASAGAHLMASALLSPELGSLSLKAFSGIYGVYDLHRHWRCDLAKTQSRQANLTENMIGAGPFDDPAIYHAASPLRHVVSKKALPAFLSWGAKDDAIDPAQSEDFSLALKQAGFNVRTRVFADAGHFWFSDNDLKIPGSFAAQLAPDLLQFFERHL